MNSLRISAWIAGAVLLFWAVGAHNRLVRLRNDIVRSFGPVDQHFSERHVLLQQQIDAVAPVLAHAAERVDSLQAACRQAEIARAHACAHPGAPGAIKSLRLADDILAEARARLPVQTVGGVDFSALNARLTASDTALAFARDEFNAAVAAYNDAVRQFPTVLVARLFNFRGAAAF